MEFAVLFSAHPCSQRMESISKNVDATLTCVHLLTVRALRQEIKSFSSQNDVLCDTYQL